MGHLVIDPTAYDKGVAWKQAQNLVKEFCEVNQITEPITHDSLRPNNFGFYAAGHIYVNVAKTPLPVKIPVRRWSFTGYKADRTAPGVLAHEFGHHISSFKALRRDAWQAVLLQERRKISGYAPNGEEEFAEAFRLFILNPDLLLKAWPVRYKFIISLEVKPVVLLDWREVLRYAHPKIITAVENLIR